MLTPELDPAAPLPLYRQLYDRLRSDIEQGKLLPDEKLPSKRSLANACRLSVMTVERTYGQLAAEGYLRSEDRRGYFVERVSVPKREEEPKTEQLPRSAAASDRPLPYDFATNVVDADSFPFSTWAKLNREVLSARDASLLTAIHPQGLLPLRQAIVRHLYQFRSIEVSPEQIVVGAGSDFLLSLLVQLLGREQIYAVENPGYPKTAAILRRNGAQVAAIPMDQNGLSIAALRTSGAAVAHVTPSHHFPLGTVMPVSRRAELLRWAEEQQDRYIIEDDYDSEFRFTGKPIPALQRLDRAERVIYLNTFTKSLSPSLRISYLVLPAGLAERFRRELGFYSSTVPALEQQTLRLFMERGHLERHIWRTRKQYRLRRDALMAAAETSGLLKLCSLSGGDAGLHLLLTSRMGVEEALLLERAKAAGVRMYPVSRCYDGGVPRDYVPTFIMGYARMGGEKIAEACRSLQKNWETLQK